MDRPYKRPKRQAVSLTSLLDLLFVMIFVSLIQQKTIPEMKQTEKKPTKTVAQKPVAKPVPKVTKAKPSQPKSYSIEATFNFYGTQSNPNLPSGKYIMNGKWDRKSGKLSLGGVAWIQRPPRYDMVPLSGTMDDKAGVFQGRVESVGCKTFILNRRLKRSRTPISGEWVGTYSCSQGKTGLTLTIE